MEVICIMLIPLIIQVASIIIYLTSEYTSECNFNEDNDGRLAMYNRYLQSELSKDIRENIK